MLLDGVLEDAEALNGGVGPAMTCSGEARVNEMSSRCTRSSAYVSSEPLLARGPGFVAGRCDTRFHWGPGHVVVLLLAM